MFEAPLRPGEAEKDHHREAEPGFPGDSPGLDHLPDGFRLAHPAKGFRVAAFEPEVPDIALPPSRAGADTDEESAALDVVRGWMDSLGPTTAAGSRRACEVTQFWQ